jgi:hypothetical protein
MPLEISIRTSINVYLNKWEKINIYKIGASSAI